MEERALSFVRKFVGCFSFVLTPVLCITSSTNLVTPPLDVQIPSLRFSRFAVSGALPPLLLWYFCDAVPLINLVNSHLTHSRTERRRYRQADERAERRKERPAKRQSAAHRSL